MDPKQRPILFLTYLQSQENACDYLKQCYQTIEPASALSLGFTNSQTFAYELQYGLDLFQAGKSLPLQMQPLLYFYGLTHLLKAVIRTKRPHYPENTKQLAHGISARKKKKQQYRFIHDEVMIQLHGLFPYCATYLFDWEEKTSQKLKMSDLFTLIPSLRPLMQFAALDGLIPVGQLNQTILTFDETILDGHYMSHNRFLKELTTTFPLEFMYHEKNKLYVKHQFQSKDIQPPFRIESGMLYYPSYASSSILLPNLLVYYAILYNLSMLSRYETEWWTELMILKQSIDYPIIQQFLIKAPELIIQEIADYLYTPF